MTAIILAAGIGKRLRPLTYLVPKPLIKIHGVSILERNIEALPERTERIVVVVRYRAGQIMRRVGHRFNGLPVLYAFQDDSILGTAGALCNGLQDVTTDCLVLNGDDLYAANDLRTCFEQRSSVLLLKTTRGEAKRLYPRHRPTLLTSVAGPLGLDEVVINTGCYSFERALATRIRNALPGVLSGELGIPELLLSTNLASFLRPTWATHWQPIGTRVELVRAIWQ